MLDLKGFAYATTTIHGAGLMYRIRKGEFDLPVLATRGQTLSGIRAAVLDV